MTIAVRICRLKRGDHAEHDQLAGYVSRRRQPDRLFAEENAALPDQVADRQRGAQDHRGNVQRCQNLDGFMRIRARRAGPVQSGMSGNQQRQPRQPERQDNQEEEGDAVGEQQAELATGHHPDLLTYGEPQ